MGQMGFFDLGNRYSGLDAKNEPLLKIDGVVPWEDLRARLEAVWRRADKARKSRAGRKPWDAIVMFKTILLCALYNLSDDQVEHQIRDRLSFMRFLGLGLEGRVPDAKTVWLYREQLTQAGVIEALFETFDGYLKDQGYLAMGGQIIDASIVAVPKQRNSREENARIKAGETPAGWEDKPAKRRQKDVEARWTKKHGKSHYGYKNHVNVDRRQAGAALSCDGSSQFARPLWVCGRTALPLGRSRQFEPAAAPVAVRARSRKTRALSVAIWGRSCGGLTAGKL